MEQTIITTAMIRQANAISRELHKINGDTYKTSLVFEHWTSPKCSKAELLNLPKVDGAFIQTKDTEEKTTVIVIGSDKQFAMDTTKGFSALFMGTDFSAITLSEQIDTSRLTNMSSFFHSCKASELILEGFDTSHVTNMNSTFKNINLQSLDLSGLETSNVQSMYCMFSFSKIGSLNLLKIDTSCVTSMENMFAGCDISSDLDLSSFNTSNVTNMNNMFNAAKLKTVNLSSFDTSHVTTMAFMFAECSVENILNVAHFKYVGCDTELMFDKCRAQQIIRA